MGRIVITNPVGYFFRNCFQVMFIEIQQSDVIAAHRGLGL